MDRPTREPQRSEANGAAQVPHAPSAGQAGPPLAAQALEAWLCGTHVCTWNRLARSLTCLQSAVLSRQLKPSSELFLYVLGLNQYRFKILYFE